MTEADPLTVRVDAPPPAPPVLALVDVWGAREVVSPRLQETLGVPFPAPGRFLVGRLCRVSWWEPNRVLVRSAPSDGEAVHDRLSRAVGSQGAVTDVTGDWVGLRLFGAGWRSLLMVGGVFDAEAAAFDEGSTAGTLLHHVPVRLEVVASDAAEVLTPPSYADELLHHLRREASRLRAI